MQLLAVGPKIYVGKIQGMCDFNIGLVFFHDLQNFRMHLFINGTSITIPQEINAAGLSLLVGFRKTKFTVTLLDLKRRLWR